jgi:sulfotransferase
MDCYHFISGTPRSGSTLLAAILGQNPAIHAGHTTPIAHIFQTLIAEMGAQSDYAGMLSDRQRSDILRGVMHGYYNNTIKRYIFDTNRFWCGRMELLVELFPECRVVACVRDPAWIMDSLERLVRKYPLMASRMFPPESRANVFTRLDYLNSSKGAVGFAFGAVKEAFYGQHSDRLLLLDYEHLALAPIKTLRDIYEFLQIPDFPHDFERVLYMAGKEFDDRFGLPGLHDVSGPVHYVSRETILPPELFERYHGKCFWLTQPRDSRARVIALPRLAPAA